MFTQPFTATVRCSSALIIAALLAGACATAPAATTYVVQAGDSLSSVADAHGVSIPALVAANEERYPAIATPSATNRLQVGWVLEIPAQTAPVVTRPAEIVSPATPAPPISTAGAWDDGLADQIVQLTNAARAEAGLAALSADAGLAEIARQRAQDIASDYSHAGLRSRCGTCGENINQAGGANAAERLMGGWLRSPGHRENILLPDVTRLGVGVYRVGDRVYAVQLFAY